MPLIRYQGKVILFVHIPKTAGTSVEDAMTQAGAVVALRYGSRFKGFMKATFQHLNTEIYAAVIPPDFYDYAFTVTRHPIPRLVSEYYYRIKRGDTPQPFDTWVNNAFDQHAKNPYVMDNHIRPQTDFLHAGVERFRVEDDITSAVMIAGSHLGLDISQPAPHANQTATKTPVQWSVKTSRRAFAFYANDFDNLGYDPHENFPEISYMRPRQWFSFRS
ncbi:MAG: sulfotransferase family 2 domain-containing protein [Yoonia sp.]|uniref:sulfotransferase family 2 domain-containing protein n=1 Tax=Yoonia sp. TaxID=2212373 RepID=UPI00326715D4